MNIQHEQNRKTNRMVTSRVLSRWPLLMMVCGLFSMAMLTGCDEEVVDPDPEPSAQTMQFKQGASYEFNTYATDAQTGNKVPATDRTRTWTLVQSNASVAGHSNVAVYLDSVITTGVVDLYDTVYLSQQPNNIVERYALLVPELDFSAIGVSELSFTRDWYHEAQLGATSADRLVGEVSDTFQYDIGVPNVNTFIVALSDSAVGSAVESITIEGTAYEATKTTHSIALTLSVLVDAPIIGPSPVKLKTVSLARTSWVVPSLGAIAKEVREGAVISADYGGKSFEIPVPGYFSMMTRIVATGG